MIGAGPRRHRLVVRVVACEARGPGFDYSSDQMVFLLSSGIRRYEKMDPDIINSMTLRIHADQKFIPSRAI